MKRYVSIDEALDVCDALLTPDEEQLLLTIIKEKGAECKEMDKLLRANMRFIVSLANQNKSKGVDLTELIWITQEAFVDAALQYEPTAETKFLIFAIQLSRNSLSKHLPKKPPWNEGRMVLRPGMGRRRLQAPRWSVSEMRSI